MNIDVVILSNTLDQDIYQMNQQAISSLLASEKDITFSVTLVESNPAYEEIGSDYGQEVELLVPKEKFNFNRFNNLGFARTRSDWVLFSNNDVVFHPGWCSAMMAAHRENPLLRCLCPVDPQNPHTPAGMFGESPLGVPGYLVRVHFAGWCFLVQRSVFNQTGLFDPRFDYYFADDDFSICLRKHNILNACVPAARVTHLANVTSRKSGLDISEKFKLDQKIFHAKWGSQRMIAMKNRLSKFLLKPMGLNSMICSLYRSK